MTQEHKEKIAKQYAWSHSTLGIDKTTFQSEDTHMIPVCQMVRVPIFNSMETAVLFGLNYAEKNIWKPADGDDLPEIDKEVIVLQGIKNPVTTDSMWGCEVAFAHRPNPNGWDGKSITTGEVEHYDVQTYDKGGWNIPDVKYWLDCELPKMED